MFGVNPTMPNLHVDFLWLPETMMGTLWAGIDVLRTAQMIAQIQQSPLETSLSWEVLRLETAPQLRLQSVQEFSSIDGYYPCTDVAGVIHKKCRIAMVADG